jgi:hypothetical protein
MSDNGRSLPAAIVVVDDESDSIARQQTILRRRFAPDYEIVTERSARVAPPTRVLGDEHHRHLRRGRCAT